MHNSNKQTIQEGQRYTKVNSDVRYVYYLDCDDSISKVCVHPNNKSTHINYMKLFACQIYINKAIKLINSLGMHAKTSLPSQNSPEKASV